MRTSEPTKTFQRLKPIGILVRSTLPVSHFEDDEACVGLPLPIVIRRPSSVVCQNVNFQALAADELQHLFVNFTFRSLCMEPGLILAWDHEV